MDIVLLFFSQKMIEQCQNKLRTSQKPWENDSAAQMIKESREIAEFYLENKKKSKKTQCLSSKTHLKKITSKWASRGSLRVHNPSDFQPATCRSSRPLRNSHYDVTYGSCSNTFELARLALVVILNNNQTSKIQVLKTGHDIMSSPAYLT